MVEMEMGTMKGGKGGSGWKRIFRCPPGRGRETKKRGGVHY